ncbi:urease accessory protein UreD [Nocardia sp. BSTN01]|uniref:urease accessory protein UreD n=1 Tax=Nocardia sp. BSTN01 TaxID=2783665 RepID=UPI00188EAC52|nr:urease accessory protein UreD [Nocardia sp. BSTN01]MBF4997095.1 urease accessory protein UreD [Nocardia sp. BSTN01]
MRTEIRIVARAGARPWSAATGALAVRCTGPDTVHLIGAAATPLGGDELDIRIVVEPGARLMVRSVAATIVLPGRTTPSSTASWTFDVGAGGELDVDPEPTVVAGGACHRAVTRVRLAADARVRIRERVQIGRTGEDHGGWCGDLIADTSTLPLLRHRLELGAGTAADDLLSAPRALSSELRYPDDAPAATIGVAAAVLPLAAGGSLSTWTGARLSDTPANLRCRAAAAG